MGRIEVLSSDAPASVKGKGHLPGYVFEKGSPGRSSSDYLMRSFILKGTKPLRVEAREYSFITITYLSTS